MRTDDMLAKEYRNDDGQEAELNAHHKRVNVHHADVDLTATVQDHVQYAQLEMDEELPGSQGHEREQRIIKKYNRHSKEVLGSQFGTKPRSYTSNDAAADLTMNELEKPVPPNYVPLRLHSIRTDTSADRVPQTSSSTHSISWSMGALSSSLAQCFPNPAIAKLILTIYTNEISNVTEERSEERRGRRECVRKCRSQWSRKLYKNNYRVKDVHKSTV